MSRAYYLGLDIGTNSVGYAVTDTTANYNLLKYKNYYGITHRNQTRINVVLFMLL